MAKGKVPQYETFFATNVYWGALLAGVASLVFVLIYALGDYPPVMALVNTLSFLLSVLVIVLTRLGHKHWSFAHILTFVTYNSMLGAAVWSGGLASSSVVWLLVIPLISMLMMSRRGVVAWVIISMVTAVAFYVWEASLKAASLIPVTSVDRLVDLLVALVVVLAAVWISETSRYKVLYQLEKARAQLQRLAEVDPLTQVYNRRYFADHAERVLSAPGKATFLTFDIDHFKQVNDEYGHATGDRVLQIVCQRVLHNLREGDILARFGGEEFVILLPNTSAEVGLQVAERMRREIAREPFLIDGARLDITISIGVTAHSGIARHSRALGELLREADEAMYRAKRNGRNRVEFFSRLRGPLL